MFNRRLPASYSSGVKIPPNYLYQSGRRIPSPVWMMMAIFPIMVHRHSVPVCPFVTWFTTQSVLTSYNKYIASGCLPPFASYFGQHGSPVVSGLPILTLPLTIWYKRASGLVKHYHNLLFWQALLILLVIMKKLSTIFIISLWFL